MSFTMSHLDTVAPDAAAPALRPLLRIQEVAALLGLTARSIRYYEEIGLLEPAARSEGAYRLFDEDNVERLRFIKGLRDDAGFSLAEIGQLLEDEAARTRNRALFRSSRDTAERRAIIEDALVRIDRQIASLQAKQARLAEMIEEALDRRGHLLDHVADLDGAVEPGRARRGWAHASSPPGRERPMTITFRGARAFRHRNYRLFFAGQAISLVGTWMQQVAQGWLVLQLTHDPLWLGLVSVAQFGPVIAFGLFGGVIADQLPKRKTLIVTQVGAMVLAFALFALTATHVVQVWHVMILGALLGISNAVDMPARQAFAVEMVGRDDVANAVGLNSALFNASRILGPAAAGLLIGAFDISIAFLINGLSFIAVIVSYVAMRESELRPVAASPRPRSWAEVIENLAEGARFVWTTPVVLLAVTIVGLVATFGMNFQVLVPPLADDGLHVGASGYGFLMAASGLGSTVAALWVAFQPRPSKRPIAGGAIALGLATAVLAWSSSYPLSLLAMVVAGVGGIAMAVTANATIQLSVPDQLRGRVMSVYTTVFAGSVPAGGLLMGAIASAWGVPAALGVGAALSLAVGLGGWLWLDRIRARQRESPVPRRRSVAPADVGAIDPEGRTAGSIGGVRPR